MVTRARHRAVGAGELVVELGAVDARGVTNYGPKARVEPVSSHKDCISCLVSWASSVDQLYLNECNGYITSTVTATGHERNHIQDQSSSQLPPC